MTIMSSYDRRCLLRLLTAVLSSLLLLFPAASLVQHHRHPLNSPPPGSFIGAKTRLGSTPPSCHNKCNGCHPCMAVQVPTLPSHNRFQPGLIGKSEFMDPSPASNNRYSNYKPLGWKCRCRDHFYNP